MKNKVNTIVFPLTSNYSSQKDNLHNEDSINVFYASTSLDTLKKAATLARKHDLAVQANRNISVHAGMTPTHIIPNTWHYTLKRVDIFVPELYESLDYEWLLEQVKIVEEGAIYTEFCLLDKDKLIVFSSNVEHRKKVPTLLIKGLTKTIKALLESKIETYEPPPIAWRYLSDLITSSKESLYKVELSDKAKRLIADMKLRSSCNTTTYHLLQGISIIVNSIQKEQIQKVHTYSLSLEDSIGT